MSLIEIMEFAAQQLNSGATKEYVKLRLKDMGVKKSLRKVILKDIDDKGNFIRCLDKEDLCPSS